jgi:hypothetical protein
VRDVARVSDGGMHRAGRWHLIAGNAKRGLAREVLRVHLHLLGDEVFHLHKGEEVAVRVNRRWVEWRRALTASMSPLTQDCARGVWPRRSANYTGEGFQAGRRGGREERPVAGIRVTQVGIGWSFLRRGRAPDPQKMTPCGSASYRSRRALQFGPPHPPAIN